MVHVHYSRNEAILAQLMAERGIRDLRDLSIQSGIPERQLYRLLHGLLPQWPVNHLVTLSQTLNLSIPEFLEQFEIATIPAKAKELESLQARYAQLQGEHQQLQDRHSQLQAAFERLQQELAALQGEYLRLQQQMTEQAQKLRQDFQQEAVRLLESWLLQWPSAVSAARNNAQFPLNALLTLIQPVEKLIAHWGITPIAQVGEELPFDPQAHQLLSGGDLAAGELVQVTHVGYRHGEKLLYRAKVTPLVLPDPSEAEAIAPSTATPV